MTDQEEFTQLVLAGWTVKQLQDKYGLSRSAVYDRKRKWNLIGATPNNKAAISTEEGNKICVKCKEEKPLSAFYANGYQPNGKKKYKSTCKACQNPADYIRKRKKIEEALSAINVEYKCSVCGYDKNYAALCFHHLNPAEKDFELSEISTMSKEQVEAEISKCVVLCHNCHMEEHYPHLNK